MEDFLAEDKIMAKIEKRIREKRKAGGAHRRRCHTRFYKEN
jgi:hypothetical protein